ncbi:acrosomal protein KIAA1210 homolog isoform 2-T2 [Discoglossus pictus]
MSALYSCLKGKNKTIMAEKSTEVQPPAETEEAHVECPAPGKKKSKFQAFKKFFIKKKRKTSTAPSGENSLKPSQSINDIDVLGSETSPFHPADDPGSKGSMGSKAVSHDSIFISESENVVAAHSSQENIPGKVKALQLQLQQNIRIGSPLKIIVPKKLEDSGALSEDDGLPRSPPEITSLHEILAHTSSKSPKPAQRRSSLSLGGTDSEDEQVSSEASSRPISPFNHSILPCPTSPATSPATNLLPVDFATPASNSTCLNNSAAKHRIAIKPKRQRGPILKLKQALREEPKGQTVSDSGRISPESETSAKQETPAEDSAVAAAELDVTQVQGVSENEETKMHPEENSIPEVSVAPPTKDQRLSIQDEEASVEIEEHFEKITPQTGDQVEYNSEDIESGEENTNLLEATDPTSEQNVVIATVHIAKVQDIDVEVTTNDDVEGEMLDTPTENQNNLLIPVTSSIQLGKDRVEEVFCLPERVQAPPIIKNALDVNDISSITDPLLQPSFNVIARSQESSMEVDEEASESVSTDDHGNVVIESTEIPQSVENTLGSKVSDESDRSDFKEMVTFQGDFEDEIIDSGTLERNKEEANESMVESENEDLCTVRLGVGAVSREEPILIKRNSITEVFEESKLMDPNSEIKQNNSTKPVRFTVAPAWQRSLSGGAKAKDRTERNISVNTICPELFEGALSPREPLVTSNLLDLKKSEKHIELIRPNVAESSVPFGIRLRSTSSSLKYNAENFGESIKPTSSSIDVEHSSSIQNISSPPKTTTIHFESIKVEKTEHITEEKNQTKEIKTEDLSQKESTEPAWITMAKLKRKGFQDHPLAREQNLSEKGVTAIDRIKGRSESSMKVTMDTLQSPEVRRSIDTTPSISPATAPENDVDPEKSPCSAAPQNTNEPPWLSLAKKKAKAWSEMPQIVQ